MTRSWCGGEMKLRLEQVSSVVKATGSKPYDWMFQS